MLLPWELFFRDDECGVVAAKSLGRIVLATPRPGQVVLLFPFSHLTVTTQCRVAPPICVNKRTRNPLEACIFFIV